MYANSRSQLATGQTVLYKTAGKDNYCNKSCAEQKSKG